jgi:hypothetical protein
MTFHQPPNSLRKRSFFISPWSPVTKVTKERFLHQFETGSLRSSTVDSTRPGKPGDPVERADRDRRDRSKRPDWLAFEVRASFANVPRWR